MPKDSTTQEHKPPEIWVFHPIDSSEARGLAEVISNRINLWERGGIAGLLIKLLAGLAANCDGSGNESCGCAVEDVTWHALFEFFKTTQKFNDTFHDYVVNDLKIAHDFRKEEESEPVAQPERKMHFEGTLERIAYIIGKTRFLLTDQCELTDDEALGKIRDLISEMDWRKEGAGDEEEATNN
jgi:hypothetical protein